MTEVLDLRLGSFSIPDAVRRTVMGVANHIKMSNEDTQFKLNENLMKELFEIAEQLEARFQDELDNVRPVELHEQEEAFTVVDDYTMTMTADGGAVVDVKGVLYGLLCNEPVDYDVDTDTHTFCCKAFGHLVPQHEDKDGAVKP